MKISKELSVRLPSQPNFILEENMARAGHPIESFSDGELRKIGDAWVEELIRRARARREAAKKP